MIYNVEVEIEAENGGQALPPQAGGVPSRSALEYSGGTFEDQPSAYGESYGVDAGGEEPAPATVTQRRVDEHDQLGRNDPCWCRSGKKFKKCHGA
jgi:preprotein translocase subunit SecA